MQHLSLSNKSFYFYKEYISAILSEYQCYRPPQCRKGDSLLTHGIKFGIQDI